MGREPSAIKHATDPWFSLSKVGGCLHEGSDNQKSSSKKATRATDVLFLGQKNTQYKVKVNLLVQLVALIWSLSIRHTSEVTFVQCKWNTALHFDAILTTNLHLFVFGLRIISVWIRFHILIKSFNAWKQTENRKKVSFNAALVMIKKGFTSFLSALRMDGWTDEEWVEVKRVWRYPDEEAVMVRL